MILKNIQKDNFFVDRYILADYFLASDEARPRSPEGKTMNSGRQDQGLMYIKQEAWEGKTKKSIFNNQLTTLQ
jgi:hypothetical protein